MKHFAEEDKRKAMKYLRPTQRKESHAVTFFIGEFCTKIGVQFQDNVKNITIFFYHVIKNTKIKLY